MENDTNLNLEPSNSAPSTINDAYISDEYLNGLSKRRDYYYQQLEGYSQLETVLNSPIAKLYPGLIERAVMRHKRTELEHKKLQVANNLKEVQAQYNAYFNNELQRKYVQKTLNDKKQLLRDMGISDRYLVNMSNMFDSNYVSTGDWNMTGLDDLKKDDNFAKVLFGLLALILKAGDIGLTEQRSRRNQAIEIAKMQKK